MTDRTKRNVLSLTIGEIISATETTQAELKEFGYVDRDDTLHILDDNPDGLITVEAYDREGQKRNWILDLKDFLPFMSDPGFRDQLYGNEKSYTFATHNLYSSMAFWLFDSSFAAKFFHNLRQLVTLGGGWDWRFPGCMCEGMLGGMCAGVVCEGHIVLYEECTEEQQLYAEWMEKWSVREGACEYTWRSRLWNL